MPTIEDFISQADSPHHNPCVACHAEWQDLGPSGYLLDHQHDCAYIAWLNDVAAEDAETEAFYAEDIKIGEMD